MIYNKIRVAAWGQIHPHLHPSPQRFIPILARPPKISSHHSCYICQSAFTEYMSHIIPEFLRCYVILCCHWKICWHPFCHCRQRSSSSILVKCVVTSAFILHPCRSPSALCFHPPGTSTTSASIPVKFPQNMWSPHHAHPHATLHFLNNYHHVHLLLIISTPNVCYHAKLVIQYDCNDRNPSELFDPSHPVFSVLLKVIGNDTDWSATYDLLVVHSNHGPCHIPFLR